MTLFMRANINVDAMYGYGAIDGVLQVVCSDGVHFFQQWRPGKGFKVRIVHE